MVTFMKFLNSTFPPYCPSLSLFYSYFVIFSRIICLELTNGGTLQDFLLKCELPLPEPCQRMIVHDIAEGLFYLHHESILHNNLTTSCIYLKGSLQVRTCCNLKFVLDLCELSFKLNV